MSFPSQVNKSVNAPGKRALFSDGTARKARLILLYHIPSGLSCPKAALPDGGFYLRHGAFAAARRQGGRSKAAGSGRLPAKGVSPGADLFTFQKLCDSRTGRKRVSVSANIRILSFFSATHLVHKGLHILFAGNPHGFGCARKSSLRFTDRLCRGIA